MVSLGEIMNHPDNLYFLLKLKMAVTSAEKQMRIDQEPHWEFCYTMLHKSLRSNVIFDLILPPTHTHLRNAVCVYYLVLRALDTVEDDTSISTDVKVPMLIAFHSHLYDRDWHFSCGRKHDKVLMDQFHYVSTAFLELNKGYQEAIEDITKRIGAGMATFIDKEVESIDDYDEYCHYASGLFGIGMSKIFRAAGKEDEATQNFFKTMLIIMQKKDIIEDFLEDINEMPKPRKLWPREIWSQYVNNIEDFKKEENPVKAVQCLNEMVTDALKHVEYCLNHVSDLKDNAALQLSAILLQVVGMGTLALCYNNIEVFKSIVRLRPGLIAKIIDRTRTVSGIYNAFFEFAALMKSKELLH
ncbi:hypothetical protein Ddye_001564 [Dipteronia dyeriana]|uniref:Squalene synthase n=1 Tax=Dipteronia dyeriana TaxID=168575 RepID=A0AAD9XPH2_9ROSI|nr:hypothetical protein Ddye_001564 [Dipteronia dyeriana]